VIGIISESRSPSPRNADRHRSEYAVEEGRCHENVSELWLEQKSRLVGIGVGYALSGELWRQHSWGVRDSDIVETTNSRTRYFGRVLTGVDADRFAEENRGDPQERHWRRLPEVWFRLQKDEDGYPPKDWEGLWESSRRVQPNRKLASIVYAKCPSRFQVFHFDRF
jgi:hypothetical protein